MSAAVVAEVKADLLKWGYQLDGNNGALLITMETAYRLRGLGFGVVWKPAGNHGEYPVGSGRYYAVDCIMRPDGSVIDILQDGGGANVPQFNGTGATDPSNWRQAVAIMSELPSPTIPPVPIELPQRPTEDVLLRLVGEISALVVLVAELRRAMTAIEAPDYQFTVSLPFAGTYTITARPMQK